LKSGKVKILSALLRVMKRVIALFLIFLILIPFVFAAELSESITDKTAIKVIWQGPTPIKDAISTKAPTDDETAILKAATDTEMQKQIYPYDVAEKATSTTTFKILSFSCDRKKFGIDADICGYWVAAYRDGKTVATNSPILISPPPITAIVSEVYDDKVDTITTTLKEDPKLAVEQILQMYVDNQPIGKAVTGTKE
jgi:hypothetical protein